MDNSGVLRRYGERLENRPAWAKIMLRAWLRRREAARERKREWLAQVDNDARDMIAGFGGDRALFEARTRSMDEMRGAVIDGNRPPHHWSAVSLEIENLIDYKGGRDWSGYGAK